MIEVQKAESYRTCGSCSSNKNVVNITALIVLSGSKQGIQIALCEDCAKELKKKLNDVYREETK